MAYPGPFPFKVEQGGTGEIALTANAVLIGENADDITTTNVGTNGQLLIGATGLAPAFASLTSTGGSITFTPGANSLNLEAGGSVAITFAADSGTATPAANIITFAGGTNVTTSATGSTVTIDASGGGFTWVEVTGTSQAMAINTGYILNNAGLVTATLPSTAAVGSVVRIAGKGSGGWLLAQNSGQTIFFGTSTTTPGVGGSLASTHRRDCVELVCVTADNDWDVLSVQGNLTVV